jgi:hypothetical protein
MPDQDPVESAVLDAIANMPDDRAYRLLCALLHSEIVAHGLPIENFACASDANERDGGVDAHLEMASIDDPPFPPGSSVWQLKSGNRKPSVSADLNHRRKRHLRECIASGDDFVLVWTRARPERVQRGIRETFAAGVAAISPDARFVALFAEQLVALAMRYPGLLVDFALTPFAGASKTGASSFRGAISPTSTTPVEPRSSAASRRELAATQPRSISSADQVSERPGQRLRP